MKFERTLVFEPYILEAIHGARLSYGSNEKSDSYILPRDDGTLWLHIGPEDEKFIRNRVLAGVSGEDKLLRTIPVSVFITAPIKFWVELDTYRIGTTRQSSSLMHRLATKGEFTPDDFEVRDPGSPRFRRMLNDLNEAYREWLDAGGRRNDKYVEWTDWQDLVPRSYLYKSHWYGSYANLRNIYFQRRNHRMKQWKEFVSWIQELPHSWIITAEK